MDDSNVRLAIDAVQKAMDAVKELHPKSGGQGVFQSYEDYNRTSGLLYLAHQELLELLDELGPGTWDPEQFGRPRGKIVV